MSEPAVFNLINAAWLPVRRRSGAVEHIQPWRVTDGIGEDPFVAFAWPRPDFNGAAHEFLIGLLSTAATPRDDEEWEDWWSNPPEPNILEERFLTLAEAFDLDGPGPRFLQDLDPLEDGKLKKIAHLLIDAPGESTEENNRDLFVKRGGVPVLGRSAAAMALYTLSAYAPEGGSGNMTSLRGGGPMTTLIVADHKGCGATLWGRLWPNVETGEQIQGRCTEATVVEGHGSVFPWLVPTRASNPKAGGRPTAPADIHPLQVYWGMPRRIRLIFEDTQNQRCGLTAMEDTVIARTYRSSRYGIKYGEGFEHPLTPHTREKSKPRRSPVHVKPGGITYRLWPGHVVPSDDELHIPAQVVRDWPTRAPRGTEIRFTAFGYNMAKMNPRAWVEGEIPLWGFDDDETREWLGKFIRQTTAGANRVTRLITRYVKSALYDRPQDAKGNYDFISERFYRNTEGAFYAALGEVVSSVRRNSDGENDPTTEARQRWAPTIRKTALRLFDEYAPADGLEDRDMRRHVKARSSLTLALSGRGKEGQSLFDGDLGIVSPETMQSRKRKREET